MVSNGQSSESGLKSRPGQSIQEAAHKLSPDPISSQASAVHHAAGHVFAMTRVALHHHGSWLKDRHGDLCHGQLLMVCLLRRDDWSIGGEHEVNPGVWHKICLEFGDVHVERTVKAQRSCPHWST